MPRSYQVTPEVLGLATGDTSFASQTKQSRLGTLGSARRQPENQQQGSDVTAQT
jgi:hypothetical protein